METTPLVSIIIPVYNVEEYLRECVDSVINQTYKNLEIILVDDGSTDSSGRICDEYAATDNRITVIHQKNAGQSSARNNGLSIATGKYIYFPDSDDYIEINSIEKLIEKTVSDNADFVYFDAVSFLQTIDNKLDKQTYLRNKEYPTGNGLKVLESLIINNDYHCSIPLMFFKKSFFEYSQLKLLSGFIYEDMLFGFQAYCEAKTVAHLNEALYFRRYRSNSTMTSNKTKKHFISIKKIFSETVHYSNEKNILSTPLASGYVARCAFNVFNNYEKLCARDKTDCRKDFSQFKKDVLANNAFGDTALKMRCYGKAFWLICKIYEKTVGRLLKGKK